MLNTEYVGQLTFVKVKTETFHPNLTMSTSAAAVDSGVSSDSLRDEWRGCFLTA